MADEKWISLNKFMEMKHVGYEEALKILDSGKYEYEKSEGGRYRIKIEGNTVSREMFEKERKKRIEAETTLKLMKNILIERSSTNEDY